MKRPSLVGGAWLGLLLASASGPARGELEVEVDGSRNRTYGPVAPKRRMLGSQPGSVFSGEIILFDEAMADAVCDKVNGANTSEFEGKILLLDGESTNAYNFRECWGNGASVNSLEYYSSWCKLGAAIIVEDVYVPGLYANDHDGVQFLGLKQSYPVIEDCFFTDIQSSPALDELKDILRDLALDPPAAVLEVDEIPCDPLFQHVLLGIWWRGCLGGGFVLTAMQAFFSLFATARRESNRLVSVVVLSVNVFTLSTLAMAMGMGGWRITDGVSQGLSNFLLPAFQGAHTANDLLLAARWHELNEEMVNLQHQRSDLARSWYRKMRRVIVVGFALALVGLDVAGSVLLTIMTTFIAPIVMMWPAFLAGAQVAVLLYLVPQVLSIYRTMTGLKETLRQSVRTKSGRMDRLVQRQKITRRLFFWMAVSFMCSTTQLLVLTTAFNYGLYLESCEGWVGLWSVFFTAKIANCMSQNKICSPNSLAKKVRVEPVGSSMAAPLRKGKDPAQGGDSLLT